mgnify:CR=1 FL=1
MQFFLVFISFSIKTFVLFFLFQFVFLYFLLVIVFLLIAVDFTTVLERKILGAIQRRRGPNAVGLFGLLQAFADALKLLSKESIIPSSSNFLIFIFSPISVLIFGVLC